MYQHQFVSGNMAVIVPMWTTAGALAVADQLLLVRFFVCKASWVRSEVVV
jgi:hypothetical protein